MPGFASSTNLFISLSLHVPFAFLISKIFGTVGMQSPFESSSVGFWSLTVIVAIISGHATLAIVPYFGLPSIADIFRLIPRHNGFEYLIQQLTDIVQNDFPNALQLKENSVRMWAIIACKRIYKSTKYVISGSGALAILISFMVRPDKLRYIFILSATFLLIWVVVSYLSNNGAAQT